MIKRERILGEMGKLGSKIFVSAATLRKEAEALSVEKFDQLAQHLKLVRRSEFEAVQAMVKEARAAQVRIEKRLNDLERNLTGKSLEKKMPSKAGARKMQGKARK